MRPTTVKSEDEKMSEEKMYAVKNDEGKYWNFEDQNGFWKLSTVLLAAFTDEESAKSLAHDHGGHVVTLIEEPKKVAVPVWFDEFVQKYEDNLSNEEMARLRIIGKICQSGWGATFNSQLNRDIPDEFNPFDLDYCQLCYVNEHKDELVHALSLNSWTVENPKRYVLPMPGTEYHNAQMRGNAQYYAVKTDTNWRPDAIALGTDDAVEHGYTVTQADIDAAPDWVKALTPAEVTDDEQ